MHQPRNKPIRGRRIHTVTFDDLYAPVTPEQIERVRAYYTDAHRWFVLRREETMPIRKGSKKVMLSKEEQEMIEKYRAVKDAPTPTMPVNTSNELNAVAMAPPYRALVEVPRRVIETITKTWFSDGSYMERKETHNPNTDRY